MEPILIFIRQMFNTFFKGMQEIFLSLKKYIFVNDLLKEF